MSTLRAEPKLGPEVSFDSAPQLEAIVGFDGSPASLRAIETARELVEGRAGRVHVVWVAHVPIIAALSPEANAGIRLGFDAVVDELTAMAAGILGPLGDRWTFQRRDGNVAHELSVAASEERDRSHTEATVIIVVGAAQHAWHRVGGSVPAHLAHQRDFAVVVTPAGPIHDEAREASDATAAQTD